MRDNSNRIFNQSKVYCPDCSMPMYRHNDRGRKSWRCFRYPKCKGNAMITRTGVDPAAKDVRRKRIAAHKELARTFKNVKEQYQWLSIFGQKAHIGHMQHQEIDHLILTLRDFKTNSLRRYCWKELRPAIFD